jgi:hypothetical protein
VALQVSTDAVRRLLPDGMYTLQLLEQRDGQSLVLTLTLASRNMAYTLHIETAEANVREFYGACSPPRPPPSQTERRPALRGGALRQPPHPKNPPLSPPRCLQLQPRLISRVRHTADRGASAERLSPVAYFGLTAPTGPAAPRSLGTKRVAYSGTNSKGKWDPTHCSWLAGVS